MRKSILEQLHPDIGCERTNDQEGRLLEVRDLAYNLMEEHLDDSWKFRFSRRTSVAGDCEPKPEIKTIRLPLWNALLSPEYAIRDTMLHEIAHAIDPYVKGGPHHGEDWKKIADDLGVDPDLNWDWTMVAPWRGNCEAGHPNYRYSKPRLEEGWSMVCSAYCQEPVYEWFGPYTATEVWWGTNAELTARHRSMHPEWFASGEELKVAA